MLDVIVDAQEPLAGLVVEPIVGVQDLQRDLALQRLVVSSVDLTLAAFTDGGSDAYVSEPLADQFH